MPKFEIVRELASIERDRGSKRLLLALYNASEEDGQENRRYIALSEQARVGEESDWQSTRKGITVRRGELVEIIKALQSADFDAKPNAVGLSESEYLNLTNYIT